MSALKAILDEIIGLFVDDGSLAIAALIWLAVSWLFVPLLRLPQPAQAAIFVLGLLAILAGNVVRASRRR